MRQLHSFLEAIRVRNTTKEYYRMSFMAKLKGAEMAPLEDILGVGLDEEAPFDKETDEKLERQALQLLAERRAMRNV